MFGPSAPPAPPPPPTPPTFGTISVKNSKDIYEKSQMGGLGSTILTSAQGDLTPSNTAKKTLLGA